MKSHPISEKEEKKTKQTKNGGFEYTKNPLHDQKHANDREEIFAHMSQVKD